LDCSSWRRRWPRPSWCVRALHCSDFPLIHKQQFNTRKLLVSKLSLSVRRMSSHRFRASEVS
jgi:hypothetical protein